MSWCDKDLRTTQKTLKFINETYANQPMLVFGAPGNRNVMTYHEFFEKAVKCSYGYYEAGYHGGRKIALLGENSPQWLLHFWAITAGGNIAVLPDKAQTPEFLARLLKRMDTECIVCSDEYQNEGKEIAEKLGIEALPMTFDEVDAIAVPEDFHPEVKERDTALIAFTSGTTGEPKGVVLSHESFMYSELMGLDHFPLKGNTVAILPMHHMYGLNMGLTVCMLGGLKILISSSLRYIPMDVMEMEPEFLCVVPLVMANLYPVFRTMKEKGLRLPELVLTGGAPISKEWCGKYEELGIPVYNGYGITECAPGIAISLTPVKGPESGMAPIMEVRIDNPDASGNGEIIVRGPNVFDGYYGQPEETAKALRDGWYHTGDIGRMDEEGLVYVTGRLKNLIILSNGENVAPEELENELEQNPLIGEVVVRQDGDELAAEIYPADPDHFNAKTEAKLREEIFEWTKKYPPFKRVTKVIVRETPFNKTTSMKIKR